MELEKMKLGGTPLKGDEVKDKKVCTLPWQPNLQYAWDNGVAIGRYLAELKKGKIIGKKCNECNRVMIPPRMFCELCFRPSDEWIYVNDTGKVNTFSVCRVNLDASRLKPGEPPHLPAVIEIDGASKGMGIINLLSEVDPKDIKIGMKVKAVWKDPKDRTGAITDIKYWKPY